MTDRLPSMPFFVGDYLSSRKVRMMTPSERGIYTHLLFQIWQDGPIEDDERTLVLLADCDRSEFRKAWPVVSEMFVKGKDELLRNDKLEEVRESALRLKQNRSKAGSKGGSKTQAKPKQESTSIPDQTIPLHSTPNQTKTEPPISPKGDGSGFEEFWKSYPSGRKVGKKAALRSWKKLKPSEKLCRKIVDSVRKQTASQHFEGSNGQSFIPNPSTWLNQGRWEDEISETAHEKLQREIVEASARRAKQREVTP